MESLTKTCKVCSTERPKDQFVRNRRTCKPCDAAAARQWRKDNPEKWKEITDRNNLKRRIDPDHYDSLLKEQGGVCAICSRLETAVQHGIVRRLCVDHCHATGRIRGLLCSACNRGLGYFRDSPDLLARAADYIQ